MSPAKEITGAQRAAAFLLSLDEEAAARVLRHLEPGLMAEVVGAMGDLDPDVLEPGNLSQIYRDLGKSLNSPHRPRPKSRPELAAMLQTTLDADAASRVLLEIDERRRQERPFHAVESYPASHVARALTGESDAVVALVLAHLDPALSADVLGGLDQESSLAIVRRMATLIPPPLETLSSVAVELERKLSQIAEGPSPPDPVQRLRTIADMLNFSQPPLEKNVLEGLTSEDKAMADEIREFMFTWNDLAGVERRAMQKILASIDTKTLSVAIKACPQEVEENILGNLSSRVREMVADERELAGGVPMSDVLAARAEIMTAVRGLMEAGDFQPARAGEDLVS